MADKIVRTIKQTNRVIDHLKHLAFRLFLLAELVKALMALYRHQPIV